VGQRRQLVIPREFMETLNIREGDFVAFAQTTNGVLIKAKRLVDDDTILTPQERRWSAAARRNLSAAIQNPGVPSNMRFHVDLSREAQEQLARLPLKTRVNESIALSTN